LIESLEEQIAFDIKFQHDYYKTDKGESKEAREKKLEIGASDFIESFVSRQKINNLINRINNCGKLQLENSFILSGNKAK